MVMERGGKTRGESVGRKLFHLAWESGSDRAEIRLRTEVLHVMGWRGEEPRDRRRQIHGRLFPLVTWPLLTTQ
ncbi:hypothetical protein PVK06_006186 [Gossypium arboreum]|uniref:Uncharacterized protein n=1 Tax=Gossypium arboreum TaxID=29729 RepID=A0ABR0QXY6_GOSAR|nr:hypothetical protein PVK06_006186 [Gossypium arboreum]